MLAPDMCLPRGRFTAVAAMARCAAAAAARLGRAAVAAALFAIGISSTAGGVASFSSASSACGEGPLRCPAALSAADQSAHTTCQAQASQMPGLMIHVHSLMASDPIFPTRQAGTLLPLSSMLATL